MPAMAFHPALWKCRLLVIFDSILAQDAWHDSFHSLAEHNAAVLKSTRVPWQGTQEIKGA